MYIIRNLPVLLALVVSVILSILGAYQGIEIMEFSVKLILSIVIFYFFGAFVRSIIINFLVSVLRENERKARILEEIEMEEESNGRIREYDGELEPYMPKRL